MTSMVERVARAIWAKRRALAAAEDIALEEYGDGTVPAMCGVLDEARAAIEAMRPPTDAMVGASLERDPTQVAGAVGDNYIAMIDAALSEQISPEPVKIVPCTCHDDASRRLCMKKHECSVIEAHSEQISG